MINIVHNFFRSSLTGCYNVSVCIVATSIIVMSCATSVICPGVVFSSLLSEQLSFSEVQVSLLLMLVIITFYL